jgi:hypothetical protein
MSYPVCLSVAPIFILEMRMKEEHLFGSNCLITFVSDMAHTLSADILLTKWVITAMDEAYIIFPQEIVIEKSNTIS